MIRTLLAMLLLSALQSAASAGPCDVEAAAAKRAGRDPALASPTEPGAKAHMKVGNEHHGEALKRQRVVATQDQAAAEFQAAIDAYVAAAMISSAPSILYNLAITYRMSGDYEKAIQQYRLFLERAKPRRAMRALVECHIDTMTAELERSAAKAPPTEPVAPDEPVPDVSSGTDPGPATATTSIEGTESLGLGAAMIGEPPGWYSDKLGWTIAGAGTATAGIGTFLLLDARDLRVQINNEPNDATRMEMRATADRRQTWGTVATVAGGALLVAGVVRLALAPEAPDRSRPRASLRLSPAGIALEGRF